MSNRFEFEQQIMDCWNVTKDIDTLYCAIGDRPTPLTNDEVMNTLLGLHQLYELKFEKLFELFEVDSTERKELLDKLNGPTFKHHEQCECILCTGISRET